MILDLHGIDVLAAADDDVFLAVDEPDEAVLVLACHIAREQPAVLDGFVGRIGVVVVADHDTRALDP